MNAKWLSDHNVKINHSIIGAINSISIHLKLINIGDKPIKSLTEIKEAIRIIKDWLIEFDKFLSAYEQNTYQALTGVNPRIQQLVKHFSSAKRKKEFSSKIFRDPPLQLAQLLSEGELKYSEELITSLADLRTFLEEYDQSDLKNLLPDL